ncbi:hypothetical protein OA57_00320 [Chelonobacter oris]|uniref:Probable Tat proofreading chaperone DmsD n=1 Tax=Chelonobacter oris TaxID=505317 RepID=A0A0A3AQB8_9PAST|nr:Tat proofreading chaperone DmsD [Chelonobacter oris]KGQ71551.1 hypothetical protein OA57_00320 [Chelonobacter oris]
MMPVHSSISQFGRILGSLFYCSPTQPQNQPLLALFADSQWQKACDFLSPELRSAIQAKLTQGIEQGTESLEADFQALFIGPDALPAPPWGSVYLDKEAVIFGNSLLELRRFMRLHGITLELQQNEPEDHIGLMLMLAAWMAENQPERLNELLQQHLLPWSGRFLELLIAAQHHPFYCGLGLFAQALLDYWRQALQLTVPQVRLYR